MCNQKKISTFAFTTNNMYVMAYLRRIFDIQLQEHLDAMGAVLVEGPKWCGKTTTSEQNSLVLRN